MCHLTANGWPCRCNSIPRIVHHYWDISDKVRGLSSQQHYMTSSWQTSMRNTYTTLKASSTQKQSPTFPALIQKLKTTIIGARHVYWPTSNRSAQCLTNHPIHALPWQKLDVDLFILDLKTYLIIADYFNKYPSAVCSLVEMLFSNHGTPDQLVSENGPPFDSHELKQFWVQHDVIHRTSRPLIPRLVASSRDICALPN